MPQAGNQRQPPCCVTLHERAQKAHPRRQSADLGGCSQRFGWLLAATRGAWSLDAGRIGQIFIKPPRTTPTVRMAGLKEPLIGEDQTKAKAKWQKLVFFITFLNYAMAHFSRKCYTNVKTDLIASGIDKIILSQMDTAFMFTYAIGSFISGRLGDTFPQNVVIGVGLLGSTLCAAATLMAPVPGSWDSGPLGPRPTRTGPGPLSAPKISAGAASA